MAKCFLRIVAVMLALTAIGKLWTSTGDVRLLFIEDPVFAISTANLLKLVAVLEIGVGFICMFRPVMHGLISVAWLSTVFLAYRVGLWWIGWKKPCSCLGNLSDAIHVSPQFVDGTMKGVLAFMFIGSVSLLILNRRAGSADAKNNFIIPASNE